VPRPARERRRVEGAARGVERLEIDANGMTFTARAAGPRAGRPVLLLHGFPQTSWGWRPVLGALAASGYRALAPDQRGYSPGARPTEVEAYAMPNLVADVLALADTLELGRFDLVGHDWGGMVAWVVASRHPERVRSLAVVSTPHPDALRAARALPAEGGGGGEHDVIGELFRSPEEPERLLLGEDASGAGLRAVLTDGGLDPAIAEEYVDTLREPGALTAALNWYRADGVGLEALPPVVVPTLYVWSSGDVALARGPAEATAEFVAGRYRFVVLDGVSHWVPEEVPGELVRLLLEHLADT